MTLEEARERSSEERSRFRQVLLDDLGKRRRFVEHAKEELAAAKQHLQNFEHSADRWWPLSKKE